MAQFVKSKREENSPLLSGRLVFYELSSYGLWYPFSYTLCFWKEVDDFVFGHSHKKASGKSALTCLLKSKLKSQRRSLNLVSPIKSSCFFFVRFFERWELIIIAHWCLSCNTRTARFAADAFFSRHFQRKSRLLQWLVFFRQFNAIGPLFCSFVQHHQLELRTYRTCPKHRKLVQDKNIDVQNLENIDSPLGFFTRIFFGTMRLFFEVFWIPPKGLPFVCFDILQHNGCQKIPKDSPFYIFLHCDTVQKSHFQILFGNFSKTPKGPPLIFKKNFATNWSFTKHKGSPFLQFWALDIAPTLAVPDLFAIWVHVFVQFQQQKQLFCITVLWAKVITVFGSAVQMLFMSSWKSTLNMAEDVFLALSTLEWLFLVFASRDLLTRLNDQEIRWFMVVKNISTNCGVPPVINILVILVMPIYHATMWKPSSPFLVFNDGSDFNLWM